VNGTARRADPLTVDEFLAFEGEADVRYELVDGEIRAMAPAGDRHGLICANVAILLHRRRPRPECAPRVEAGIRVDDHDFFVADVVLACGRPRAEPGTPDPWLIVEVLSPSTRLHDLGLKADRYRELAGLRELWLVDSERRRVQQWLRRGPRDWHVRDVIGTGTFDSPVLAATVSLDELYEGIAFAEEG